MRSKIDIKDTEYKISDREIESKMDFDSVVDNYRNHVLDNSITRRLSIRFSIIIGIITLIISGVLYFGSKTEVELSENLNKGPLMEIDSLNEKLLEGSEGNRDTVIVKNHYSNTEDKINIELDSSGEGIPENKLNFNSKKVTTRVKSSDFDSPKSQKTVPIKSIPKQEDKKAESVYTNAKPLYGNHELKRYFDQNLVYPPLALKDSIEGLVKIQFSINTDSTISNIIVVESLGEVFDDEAIRLIKNMPKWIPAMKDSQPVKSEVRIPFTFTIEK
ncbi:energy transducer TonB [Marinigracilibium pacificum]|uniref:Energy transducer TonB n=1 Tax=Marinigracilibium pacificum TaxID=2729599 RepID=A0A848ITH0_9BACT|nr:energy transducer TonB [Marinigracilibium pacificum]NMM47773.1 energy transducer TonB [Marinigracilibium pacificum]